MSTKKAVMQAQVQFGWKTWPPKHYFFILMEMFSAAFIRFATRLIKYYCTGSVIDSNTVLNSSMYGSIVKPGYYHLARISFHLKFKIAFMVFLFICCSVKSDI